MATKPAATPLIVIVGQTASGKTALAVELAKNINGEIICADSRTIFIGMDIGTAKPMAEERQGIPHHLLDIVSPDQSFTVADFKKLATTVIEDIYSRGKIPILVGGSGLYIDSVIYDFQFRPIDTEIRDQFKNATVDELQEELLNRGIELPENAKNPRYLLRTLEAGKLADTHNTLRENTLIIGLSIKPEVLAERITKRIEEMVERGLINEVETLSSKYGWDVAPMQASAYKSFRGYLEGKVDLDTAKVNCAILDTKLAKKQRSWFKRNNSIQWLAKPSQAHKLVEKFRAQGS